MNVEKIVRKKIIAQLPYFWLYVCLSFIISIVIQVLTLIPALFMQRIIDEYIPDKNMKNILFSFFIFTGIPILTTLLSTIYNYFINVAGRRFGQKLSVWAFEKILYQPMNYFNDQNSAELSSYCKSEANKYIVFLLFDLPSTFANIISGIVVYVFLFKISVPIAWMVLLAIPFAILPSLVIAKRIDKYIKKVVENNAKLSQIMTDTFRGIRLVKSMNLGKDRLHRINLVNEDIVKVWSRTAALDNLNGSWVSGFSNSLFTGSVFLLAVYLIIKGDLTVGMLVVILNYLPKVFSIVSNSTGINFSLKKQLAEFDKLFSIISMKDERDIIKTNIPFKFNKTIEFNNITFAYSSERGNVLNGLSLTINKNEWVGIVGRSGAGKSTIFDLLLRFYDYKEGQITIDNTDLKELNIEEVRRNIVLVSQDPFLFPGTIGDNLRMANKTVSNNEIIRVIEEVGLKSFFKELPDGLETELGENGIQLSGGEKQRLSLAQGLLQQSTILLLDEVTSNVDMKTEIEIKETIKRLMQSKDLTVISISHKLDFLEYADRVILIENGIVADYSSFNKTTVN